MAYNIVVPVIPADRFFFEQYHFPCRGERDSTDENRSDSPWGLIYNLSQGLGIPPRELLYEWSYENLLLMSRATPDYRSQRKEDTGQKPRWNPALDANEPDNFTINPNSDDEDEEYIV